MPAVTTAEFNALIEQFDTNQDGDFDRDEIKAMIEQPIEEEDAVPPPEWMVAIIRVNSFVGTIGVQTVLYVLRLHTRSHTCVFHASCTGVGATRPRHTGRIGCVA